MSTITPSSADGYTNIHSDIVALLESARKAAARSVNALMTASYWEIGRRIVEFEQGGKERAAYGQALLKRLSVDLTRHFGRGFSERNLEQMRLFYLAWPQERISQTPSANSAPQISQTASADSPLASQAAFPIQASGTLSALARAFPLPCSAYVRLLSVKSEAARAFYQTEALRCASARIGGDPEDGERRSCLFAVARAGGAVATGCFRVEALGRAASAARAPNQIA